MISTGIKECKKKLGFYDHKMFVVTVVSGILEIQKLKITCKFETCKLSSTRNPIQYWQSH